MGRSPASGWRHSTADYARSGCGRSILGPGFNSRRLHFGISSSCSMQDHGVPKWAPCLFSPLRGCTIALRCPTMLFRASAVTGEGTNENRWGYRCVTMPLALPAKCTASRLDRPHDPIRKRRGCGQYPASIENTLMARRDPGLDEPSTHDGRCAARDALRVCFVITTSAWRRPRWRSSTS